MKTVPKPQGFDLRDKRAMKSSDPTDWTPADAVYSASQRIQGKEVTDLVVYWWERDPDTGESYLRWANATSSKAEHCYLMQKALNVLLGPK